MKNPTFQQLGGLSGSVADRLRDIQNRLDGEKLQVALSDPTHPFHQGVVALALELFPVIEVTEKDGIIYTTFISNGWSGQRWVAHFNKQGIEISPNALTILNSPQFKASKAGTVRHGAILKGELFEDDNRITRNIRAKAAELKLKKLDMETQCFIRDALTNKAINDLGLNWIVGMHEPVEIGGVRRLLTVNASGVVPGLGSYYDGLVGRWHRVDGFAFDASQVLKT